jgi:hypothetical protein
MAIAFGAPFPAIKEKPACIAARRFDFHSALKAGKS